MKRVRAYAYGRPFGVHNFEFFVPEDMTDDQIEKEIKHKYECSIGFDTEDRYEEVTETVTRYEKKK